MHLLINAALAAAICAAVIIVLWVLMGKLMGPVGSEEIKISVTLRLRGEAEGLEPTLRWLSRLRGENRDIEVIMLNEGMTDSALRAAEMLAGRYGFE